MNCFKLGNQKWNLKIGNPIKYCPSLCIYPEHTLPRCSGRVHWTWILQYIQQIADWASEVLKKWKQWAVICHAADHNYWQLKFLSLSDVNGAVDRSFRRSSVGEGEAAPIHPESVNRNIWGWVCLVAFPLVSCGICLCKGHGDSECSQVTVPSLSRA